MKQSDEIKAMQEEFKEELKSWLSAFNKRRCHLLQTALHKTAEEHLQLACDRLLQKIESKIAEAEKEAYIAGHTQGYNDAEDYEHGNFDKGDQEKCCSDGFSKFLNK